MDHKLIESITQSLLKGYSVQNFPKEYSLEEDYILELKKKEFVDLTGVPSELSKMFFKNPIEKILEYI
jgi:hypothetical protein